MCGVSATTRRRGLVGLAALIPVVPILIGIVLTAGSVPVDRAQGLSFKPAALTVSGPPGRGSLVALVTHRTTIHATPGGSTIGRLGTHTEFGSPEALWVIERSAGWLGIVSPLVGNGKVGWIPAGTASLSRVPWQIRVSLSARRLTVLEDNRAVARYTVAIGRPSAPTPTGRFAVTDRLNTGDPAGPYGCCILALSARSPHAIQGWSGGDRIAIHSTPETATIGEPVSHGCLRLTLAEGRWLLAHIPLGTPTLIRA